MKRVLCLCLGTLLLSGMAAAQSLGEIARQQRQQKKPTATKVWTNDNLPSSAPINIGSTTVGGEPKAAPAGTEEAQPATPEDKAKVAAEWRAKFGEQKKSIALLERELDVLQREYKQRAAVFYADAGNRLRDDRRWADADRKYQADIAAKQKDLAAARQKLDDLREQARRAGLPSSVSE